MPLPKVGNVSGSSSFASGSSGMYLREHFVGHGLPYLFAPGAALIDIKSFVERNAVGANAHSC